MAWFKPNRVPDLKKAVREALKVARERFQHAIGDLLQKARGFPVERILINLTGDTLHGRV